MHILPQDFAVAGSADGEKIKRHFGLPELGPAQLQIGAGGGQSRLGGSDQVIFSQPVILADNSLFPEFFNALEAVLPIRQQDLGLVYLGLQ